MRLRGSEYVRPAVTPLLVGRLHAAAMASVAASAKRKLHPAAKEAGQGADGAGAGDGGPPDAAVPGRPFRSSIGSDVLDRIQPGTMRTVYRGVPFFKSPFDIALYLQLLSRLAPRTVIEIGTKYGGSARWFADMLTAQEVPNARVVSVDIEPAAGFADPRITFLQGDAKSLGAVLTPALLQRCPRPWLVIEDSSHHYAETAATLAFFHTHLQSGDYIVVEDGVVAQLTGRQYRQYLDGPNRGVADFLARHGACYAIDTDLCDRFGYNATYNPNGWLRRL